MCLCWHRAGRQSDVRLSGLTIRFSNIVEDIDQRSHDIDVTRLNRMDDLRRITMPDQHACPNCDSRLSLTENVADLVLVLDSEGIIRYVSPSVEWILGFVAEDMIGTLFVNGLHLDDRSSTRSIISHGVQNRGFITSIEYRCLHHDGGWRVFEGVGQHRPGDPETTGFVITARDVTDRKQTEEALRESEERFRQLAENTNQVFWLMDAATRKLIYANQAFEQIWGFPPAELLQNGRPWLECVHPEDLDRIADAMNAVATDSMRYVEYRIIRPDGGIRWLLDRSFPIRNAEGEVYRLGGIAEDITPRKQYEARIIAAKEKAEEMARLKTALLTNMSHEIRTPLTGIIGFASVLVSEVAEEQREFVQLIERSGKRLMSTLNSVLDLARLESRQMDTRLEVMDLASHVRDTVGSFQHMAAEKQLQLTVDVPSAGAFALLDRSSIDIILNNLVGNAIKFTDRGSVTVAVAANDVSVSISVKDTGIGISREFIPELFDEFKQESSGLTRTHEGSGLGLSITKRLVQLLDGEIQVQSEKGKGSEFVATFPRARAGEYRGSNGKHLPHSVPDRLLCSEFGKPRLLIVEDNVETQRLYHYFLGPRFDLEVVSNAEAAFQAATTGSYAGVLVDINLGSGNTGEDLLRMLRTRTELDQIPLIAVTAYALPGDRDYFLTYGFDGYVSKPFAKEELFDALRACDVTM